MKADEPRSATKHKHVLDHELPTVIHHPEDNMNQLQRWLVHAQENPVKFWGTIVGITAVCMAFSVMAGGGFAFSHATTDEAWTKLETAQTAADRLEIAKDFPNTPAERWALLQAASEYYNEGFVELPDHKDAALPKLNLAVDTFKKVVEKEPDPNSIQARLATLGAARALEARGDLDKATKQYEKVIANKAWDGTEEAKIARHQINVLKTPEAIAFYDQLYKFKPPTADLPPSGSQSFDFLKSPIFPAPAAGDMPGKVPGASTIPLPIFPSTGGSAASSTKEPDPLTVPPPPPSPSVAPKAKDESAPAKSDDLPKNVFAPEPAKDKEKK